MWSWRSLCSTQIPHLRRWYENEHGPSRRRGEFQTRLPVATGRRVHFHYLVCRSQPAWMVPAKGDLCVTVISANAASLSVIPGAVHREISEAVRHAARPNQAVDLGMAAVLDTARTPVLALATWIHDHIPRCVPGPSPLQGSILRGRPLSLTTRCVRASTGVSHSVSFVSDSASLVSHSAPFASPHCLAGQS